MHEHHPHDHDHGHGHHHHHAAGSRLRLALTLTLAFTVVEIVGGLWSGSLALLGDAGHMFTDSIALGLAATAAWLAKRPPSPRHSYGLGRAEVLAALTNAVLMLAVVVGIATEAVQRLLHPEAVKGGAVMIVAAIGFGINLLVFYILESSEENLNVRAALLHVLGDLLGSVAALVAGAVIYYTGWTPIDPILAVLVCLLILYSTLRLLRDSVHVMMEGVPLNMSLPEVGRAMAAHEEVMSVHDLHVWTLSSGMVALSAHVVLRDLQHWEQILHDLSMMLEDRFNIGHITLQPESSVHVLQPMDISEIRQN